MNKPAFTVLDNSNIVESYPGITLPLTCSFIRIAYRGVVGGLVSANLKNETILAKYEDSLANMITSYQGRVYYCINNWYLLIDLMPFSKRITPVWQDMMGVKNTEIYLGRLHDFTFGQKAKMYANMLRNALHIPRDMERLEQSFADVVAHFEKAYNEDLSILELLGLFHEIEHRALDKWYVTLANDLHAFLWTGLLKRKLRKKGVDVTGYISGITSLESLKPLKALLHIAREYGDEKDLLSKQEVKDYIKMFGDRGPCELKLETMSYREDHKRLEEQVREFAKDKARLDERISGFQQQEMSQEKGGFIAKRARLGIKNREISRLNRSRIYGMVRRLFLSIGNRLYQDGYIDEQFDVFYLEFQEIESGDYGLFRELVAKRKAEYEEYEKLPARSRLVFRGDKLIDEKTEASWTGEFTGIGTSQGSVTAEAVVVESPNERVDVTGKIIITKTTDPGWVFLLAMAKGIVAEKGSLLSHTAIVSRELRIPAVVAVENATSVIKTGDIVKVDGNLGKVEIVQAN